MDFENTNIESIKIRRNWFKKHLNQFVETIGSSEKSQTTRYTCPCCGFPTLQVRNLYDCCTVCFWEDDGQDDQDADKVWGGPNIDYSLSDARRNFLNYLSMFSPKDEGDFSIHSGEPARKAKQDLLDYYELIKGNPTRYRQQKIIDQLLNYFETISQTISRQLGKSKES
jgi:hypothetical protein